MSLTLTQIIAESDVRAPNTFDNSQKVNWLNEINQDFFDSVKMPVVATFESISGISDYLITTTSNQIRAKNIDEVFAGNAKYRSLISDSIFVGQNYWNFDDATQTISLFPAPIQNYLTGFVRYYKINTTTFLSSSLSVSPDAPPEYHWIYILGLSAKIATAMDDTEKADNYYQEYKAALNTAQQNYTNKTVA